MNDNCLGHRASEMGPAHCVWKIARIGLLSLALALAGCGKSESPVATPAPAAASTPEPASKPELSAAEQQWRAWFEHCSSVRSIGESATTANDGKVAMEDALRACRSYSREAPASQAKQQIHAWIDEAESWIRFFTAVYGIESAIKLDEFDRARELLSSAREDMHEGEIQRFTQLIDSREAELMRDWIPVTLDMPGYPPGPCTVGRDARNLDEVEHWLQERRWLRVIGVYRTPEHIAIDHFDGLLQMRGTLTFYKDMATCKAMRGE